MGHRWRNLTAGPNLTAETLDLPASLTEFLHRVFGTDGPHRSDGMEQRVVMDIGHGLILSRPMNPAPL